MYRYGQPPRSSRSKYQQTVLLLLLLVLIVTSVSLAIAYADASRANDTTRNALLLRLKNEISWARTRASQLLPTGGSKTESAVATVRQHVYAVRTVNELTASIYGAGKVLINEASINVCVGLLDECDVKIQSGAVVTDTYNSLVNAIEDLVSQAALLE